MSTRKTLLDTTLCLFASVLLVMGTSTAVLAQSHTGGGPGGSGQHETGGEHESGGCSGGHEAGGCGGGEEHEGGGKGPMYRGGGVIRGRGGGAGNGDLHDIFDQMDEIEGNHGTVGGRTDATAGHGMDQGE